MKVGDYVDVHFDTGCQVGILISDEGETVSVAFRTVLRRDIVITEIPKELVTIFLET